LIRGVTAQRLGILAVVAALTVSAAMLLLIADYAYGPLLASSRQEATSAQVPDTAALAPAANSLDLSVFDQPRNLPEIHFVDAENRALTLADFRGRVVLLNIWATWCVPCRKEMPALDRLQAQLGGDDFVVVPLSIDRKGVEAVKAFYEELGLQKLGIYVDASGAASRALGAPGVPTTLLIDRNGREVARKMGAAEWDGPEMVSVIRHQIEAPAASKQSARP
jgi:thiol-disulfide isomerase/thioredoxin